MFTLHLFKTPRGCQNRISIGALMRPAPPLFLCKGVWILNVHSLHNVAEKHAHFKHFKMQSSLKGLSCKRVEKTNKQIKYKTCLTWTCVHTHKNNVFIFTKYNMWFDGVIFYTLDCLKHQGPMDWSEFSQTDHKKIFFRYLWKSHE